MELDDCSCQSTNYFPSLADLATPPPDLKHVQENLVFLSSRMQLLVQNRGHFMLNRENQHKEDTFQNFNSI